MNRLWVRRTHSLANIVADEESPALREGFLAFPCGASVAAASACDGSALVSLPSSPTRIAAGRRLT
jgi:hypothetical protein